MASSATQCACCRLPFGPLRWQHPCDGCHRGACRTCVRKLSRGTSGMKAANICINCVSRGILIRADRLEQAMETTDLMDRHRREKARLCRDYDSLEAFAVQLQCALRRKAEALADMQELATSTPRFNPGMAGTPLVRRVELNIPFCQSPQFSAAEEEDDETWLRRKSRADSCSRRSVGGQSTVSRKSGENNWEEVDDWQDQNERIQELMRHIESLKKQNGELKQRQEAELKNLREQHTRDFDRFVKTDMKCMKYETQLLEEQQAHGKLKEESAELQKENQILRANLANMKAMFEADLDESQRRIQDLEDRNHRGWFGGQPKGKSTTLRTGA